MCTDPRAQDGSFGRAVVGGLKRSRDSCQQCSKLKLGVERVDYTSISESWDVKLGDWYCSCGVHNYASHSSHFKWHMVGIEDDVASVVAQSWGFRYSGAWSSGWKSSS
ncbi:hypothetical protein C4D60_Mb06t23460 [Musa balbisiana]|uniref:Uncharacterized protein n=1 Tax=Musa balbisiana TaxID=52838 RepID=A0A4V4H447_MUSBA|nr:hypothetical protein C4D60_Mb06t23460 [Musa balbisiana]